MFTGLMCEKFGVVPNKLVKKSTSLTLWLVALTTSGCVSLTRSLMLVVLVFAMCGTPLCIPNRFYSVG